MGCLISKPFQPWTLIGPLNADFVIALLAVGPDSIFADMDAMALNLVSNPDSNLAAIFLANVARSSFNKFTVNSPATFCVLVFVPYKVVNAPAPMPVLIVIPQGATAPIKISVGSGGAPESLLIDNIDILGGVALGDAAGFFLAILTSARDAVFTILSPITVSYTHLRAHET